jgi:hypothetical protein
MEPVAALMLQRRRCFCGVRGRDDAEIDVKGGGDGAVIGLWRALSFWPLISTWMQ